MPTPNPDDRGTPGADNHSGDDNANPPRDPGDEGFGNAFDEAIDVDQPERPSVIPAEPVTPAPPVAAASPSLAQPFTPSTPPSDAPPEQQPGESDEAYKQRWSTLQGIYKKEKFDWETEKQNLLAEIAKAKMVPPAPVQHAPPPAAIPPDDALSPEDQKSLAEYEQDFDTVSKMEGLKRSRELAKLRRELDEMKAMFKSEVDQVRGSLTPIMKSVEERSIEDHFSAIRTAHPDFETYRDDGSIKSWIEAKPAYIRPALLEIYTNGQAENVIQLIADFKRESNLSTPPSEPVNPPPNVSNISVKREQRRSALQSVPNRRGAVQAFHNVATDYDSAFDEALRKT